MPTRVCCWVAIMILSLIPCSPLLAAQEISQRDWYTPLTDGDGLRYPLEIGPLTWHVVGSGIYPAKGSDGLIHLAYALQATNSWSVPATIKSVEVVDPAHGNQMSGKNRVLDIRNGRGAQVTETVEHEYQTAIDRRDGPAAEGLERHDVRFSAGQMAECLDGAIVVGDNRRARARDSRIFEQVQIKVPFELVQNNTL